MKYSIVNLSKSFTNDNDYRLDSDYYHPSFLDLELKINILKNSKLENIDCYITDGEHGSPEWDKTTNIKYITAECIKPNYIQDGFFQTISKKQDLRNNRSRIQKNDVLIYSVGVFAGFAAKAEEHLLPANIPRSVAIIRLNNFETIFPEYLSLFLNSKYGEFQTKRLQAGNAQPMLALEKIKKIKIVLLNHHFQILLKNIYNKAYNSRLLTKSLINESNEILLKNLDLLSWQPKHKLYSIKKYSDVENVNRFDAEYFQPKYDEIIEKIKSYPSGWDYIGNLFNQNKKSFVLDKDAKYNYVEIGSVNTSNGEIMPEIISGRDLPANAKIKLFTGDILVSKVRTYRGAVAVIESSDYIGSGAFAVLQEKTETMISKETLYTFFKLKPILDLTLKYNAGTSYPTITDEDILNMPIPKFNQDIQSVIKKNVQECKKMQLQSKQLLEIAKRGVEIAIEENEDIATEWINEQLLKIGVML